MLPDFGRHSFGWIAVMKQVQVAVMVIYTVNIIAQCSPINNGFSVKFNPVGMREVIQPKNFGALFAKISQDLKTDQVKLKQEVFSKQFSQLPDIRSGCTNQIVRVSLPIIQRKNGTQVLEIENNILRLPIIGTPFEKYTMLVVAAPPDFSHNGLDDEEPMVIYIVFPDHNPDISSDSVYIPTIYFARKRDGKFGLNKERVDPILVINNNRTVTSLKSKEMRKFLTFKNKFNAWS